MDTQIVQAIKNYPQPAQESLSQLHALVLETAEQEGLGPVQQTLKWGEPSFVINGGSTIRMDWKPSRPEQVALFFHCQSKLVDTFKELYADYFSFEGNRAIWFIIGQPLPREPLKHCLFLAMSYHSRKHLPLLGV